MTPYDAVFLAVAAGAFSRPGKRWWLCAFAPLLASLAGLALPERISAPVTALAVILIAPRAAAAALILVIPTYAGPSDAIVTVALWLVATLLLRSFAGRLTSADLPTCWRGAPARLLATGILYYALLPMGFR